MKLVQCKITVHTADEYQLVIKELLRIYTDHNATFSAPAGFTVTVTCNHIQAERNLDNILEKLSLQCEKRAVDRPEVRPAAPDYEKLRAQAAVPLFARPVAA